MLGQQRWKGDKEAGRRDDLKAAIFYGGGFFFSLVVRSDVSGDTRLEGRFLW